MNSQTKIAITTALYHVASASPAHERNAPYREQHGVGYSKPSAHLSSDWKTQEHHFLWSAYERAVYDYFGIGLTGGKFVCADIPSEQLATRGVIDLPNGGKRNILELLGIDPEWAWSQIQKAINYNNKKAA